MYINISDFNFYIFISYFNFYFRNLSQGSSDTGFFGSMEKDKKQRRQRYVNLSQFHEIFILKN